MRQCAALLAVVLAAPGPAWAQAAQASSAAQTQAPASAPASAPAPSSAPAPATTPAAAAPANPSPADPDLSRIKRRLDAGTPLLDAVTNAPVPTFRVSVTEKVDIWKFWGEPDAVAAYVRPRGGSWHQEFQNMVTPDEFKGYGGILGNGEKLQLAATSLAVAGAMKLLGMGVRQARQGLDNRAKRKAKEEVQQELEAFFALHPEARSAAPP